MSAQECRLRVMTSETHLRLVVLGSGSAGNACAVTDGNTTVLIDCGFSAKETARRLGAAGLAPTDVSAILLTHEHSDHIRGVDVFARRHAHGCAVYGTRGTLDGTRLAAGDQRVLKPGSAMHIGSLAVIAFRTSHDASEPVGYRIESASDAIGVVTDTGVLTDEIAEALAGCSTLALESNHDVTMLEQGPYPAFLKRRIASSQGHLSNEAAADAVERLMSDRLVRLIGMHRSRTNNTSHLAEAALRRRVSRLGAPVEVHVARQDEGLDSHPPQGRLFG